MILKFDNPNGSIPLLMTNDNGYFEIHYQTSKGMVEVLSLNREDAISFYEMFLLPADVIYYRYKPFNGKGKYRICQFIFYSSKIYYFDHYESYSGKFTENDVLNIAKMISEFTGFKDLANRKSIRYYGELVEEYKNIPKQSQEPMRKDSTNVDFVDMAIRGVGGFCWTDTDQGYEYWSNVLNNLDLIKEINSTKETFDKSKFQAPFIENYWCIYELMVKHNIHPKYKGEVEKNLLKQGMSKSFDIVFQPIPKESYTAAMYKSKGGFVFPNWLPKEILNTAIYK
jgi:hypothetical protein